jgi:putative ABC transport system permease protein
MVTFAVAAFIFNVLVAIPSSMDMILRRTSESLRLYSYNADGRYLGLPARYCRTIDALPHVVASTSLTNMRASYQNQHEVIQAFAVDADKAGLLYPDYGFERPVLDQFMRERTAALVGQNLMRNHKWRIGDTVTLRADSNRLDIRFKLLGELPARNYPNFFMFHRDYLVEAEKARGISEDERPASLLVTRVDRIDNVPRVIREIDDTFHNSDFETATMTESEAVAGLLSTVGDLREIVYTLFAVILVVVFLIAANSMSMSVRDRIRDVAILRTLGFGAGYLATMLLGECVVMAGVGGIVGSGLAMWLFGGTSTLGAVLSYAGYLSMNSGAALIATLAAVGVALLSALAPVINALRESPIEALGRAI